MWRLKRLLPLRAEHAGRVDWWNIGVAGGYERRLDAGSADAVVGLGISYINSDAAVKSRLSKHDIDGLFAGAYGAWSDGPWSVAGSLAYSFSRVTTLRQIRFGDVDRTARAKYSAHSLGLSGEAAYAVDLDPTTTLSPVVTFDLGPSSHGNFSEKGAGSLNLTARSESWTRANARLGAALAHSISGRDGAVSLSARALWEHAIGDLHPVQSLSLAGSQASFDVRGPELGRDRLRLSAGLLWKPSEAQQMRVGYDGAVLGEQSLHSRSISFNFKF